MTNRVPSVEQLEKAHVVFLEREARAFFYPAAAELVALALTGGTSLDLAEALAVLLLPWNTSYYRYHPFDIEHVRQLKALMETYGTTIKQLRERSILSFVREDEATIVNTYEAFERVLGPVGASKALHLLCPDLFPLWDRRIARGYGLALGAMGKNSLRYVKFIYVVQHQCNLLASELRGINPLKRLDEYNYCVSKGWIRQEGQERDGSPHRVPLASSDLQTLSNSREAKTDRALGLRRVHRAASRQEVSCHEAVLEAARTIVAAKGRNEFSPEEIIRFLQDRGSPHRDSTIRTHVVSRCCRNAPNHHLVVYDYFERVGRGLYRVL